MSISRYKVGRCRLRVLLTEKRLSQDDLAILVDMKKEQISNYVRNKQSMSLDTAKTIAAALNVHIDDLYEWEKSTAKRKR